MSTPNRIPLDEADAKTLAYYAGTVLGLEIKNGLNGGQLRAKILAAQPDCKDVLAMPPAPAPVVQPSDAPYTPPLTAAQVAQAEARDPDATPANHPALREERPSADLLHHSHDPKVKVIVHKTDDKRRAREVTLACNGDVIRLQRGVAVAIPYRFYLVLVDAKEDAAVETDDINPFTGNPVMGWEQVQSYPFQVIEMPPAEEIEAWHRRTDRGFGFKAAA